MCLFQTSARFTSTSKIEPSILKQCFGLSEAREGHVCDACRRAVNRHKQNKHLLFNNLVDSKEKTHSTNRNKLKATGRSLANWNIEKTNSFSLELLPNELLEKILSYLSVEELFSIHAVSRKFYDFCLDFDERLWLPIVKRKHLSLFNKICGCSTGCTSSICSWKAVYLFFTSTNRHVSQIEQQNEHFVQYIISRNQALGESERISKELASLRTIQGDSLMPEQEKMFTSMVKLKLRRSEAGLIPAHDVRGGLQISFKSDPLRREVLRLAVVQ